MKHHPILGTIFPDATTFVRIDLDRLVETRLLIQANSGAGKSWTIRRLLEQTHGSVQQIVVDREDEFSTLRATYDYILAGTEGGECPADVRSAALLARRLLELRVSAVVGISELKAHERPRFVKLFLESLINAPRDLWHPCLVVIDEAHIFCPQSGDAESGPAVRDLMTLGRKRGLCGILATQRISKLDKSAAAECNNFLIGRASLDVDRKRAADALGFTDRGAINRLQTLPAGRFFAFGPALSPTVVEVQVGTVGTEHPKIGQRQAPVPAPGDQVKLVLAQLADLPREAEQKAAGEQELRAEVSKLRRELSLAAREPKMDPAAIEAEAEKRLAAKIEPLGLAFKELLEKPMIEGLKLLAPTLTGFLAAWPMPRAKPASTGPIARVHPSVLTAAPRLDTPRPPQMREQNMKSTGNGNGLPSGAARILAALASWAPQGLTDGQVRLQVGLSNSGTWGTYRSRLMKDGLVERRNGVLYVTRAGMDLAGNTDIPPATTAEVLERWRPKLPVGAWRIMDAILGADAGYWDGRAMPRHKLAEAAGLANSGTFGTYLSLLRRAGLIIGTREGISANREALFLS